MNKVWSKLSIGKKLFLAMMVTVGAVVAFIAVLITFSMRAGFSEYVLQAELDRFDPLVEILVQSHDPNNPGWPELKARRSEFEKLIRSALPPRARPLPVGNDGAQKPPQNATARPNRKPPRDPMQFGSRLAIYDAAQTRVGGAPIKFSDAGLREVIGPNASGQETVIGYIAIARSGAGNGASDSVFLNDQLRVLGLTLVMALILSGMAAFILARQFTRPVNRLVSGTKRLSQGEYDLRLDKTSEDEFGNLVEQFNILAAQLNAQEIAERQWMSDTSHELQTPLAVLRAEIEAMQDGVRQADEKTLSTLHHSVIRLSGLVKDISQLSNAREGKLVGNWTREDISTIAAEAAQKSKGLIEDAGLTLQTDLQQGLMGDCDAMRIGQLIDNILTNARRYTNAPGTIHLSVEQQDDAAIIRVDDTNNRPSDEAMGKLFDRFYREDQSRTRGSKSSRSGASGGSGLGLSICKLIVDAHHGEIRAEASPMGGLAMIIKLPLKRQDQLPFDREEK